MSEVTKDNFLSLGRAEYCISKIFNKLELASKLNSTHFPFHMDFFLYEGARYNSEGFGSELMRNSNNKR